MANSFKQWAKDTERGDSDWMSDINNLRKSIDKEETEMFDGKNKNKGDKTMNWMNKLKDRFVMRVNDVVMDMVTGNLGIVKNDTITTVVFDKDKDTYQVKNNPITDMGLKIPGFAMRTELANVNPGDIVYINGNSQILVDKTDKGMKVVNGEGAITELCNTNDLLLGSNGFMVVKNFFSGMDQNMLPMLFLMGDEMGDDNLPLMLMMMGGLGGNTLGGMNPMMMAMMMGGKGGGKFDMKTLMLMQMMGGKGGTDAGGFNMGSMMPWLMMDKIG